MPTDSEQGLVAVRDAIAGVFEFAWQRLMVRLDGLGDDEYRWEPVAGCWNVREGAPGAWTLDGGDEPDPPPVTTIAWRTCHLGGHVLGGFGNWLRDGGSPYEGDEEVPGTAAGGRELLGRNYAKWRDGLRSFPEERLLLPIGDAFGPFAEASALDLMCHVLDETIHHAAEIGLLRDLYARSGPGT